MYTPPQDDIRFTLELLLGYQNMAAVPGLSHVTPGLVTAVLDQAGKLASTSFAPLNHKGDKEGLKFENGQVKMPEGFAAAYKLYAENGWNGLTSPEEFGGQNMPFAVAMAAQEMFQSANLSLALCTLLNQGAIELLTEHGTDQQKKKYLPKMINGAWTGTMNLTEPHAGSDVGAVATKAWKEGDHYRVRGQKIFISYGEHDLSENIMHLVLARLPDAPPGSKGLSLFLVPKRMVSDDGASGDANDVVCAAIEHKLGQHASPTCTMSFGDKGGAYAELVGRENRGLEAMFVMMNNARLGVGIQGLALCETATQMAADFARTRAQGRPLDNPSTGPVVIIQHPDVRRMLIGMRAQIEAARAVAYQAALAADKAKRAYDRSAQARVDLLTPIVKSWLTDLANEITSTAIQVHGGMGYIEETGIAQLYRDARVLAIYEGTNGIQANDLVFRKILRDNGAAMQSYMAEVRHTVASLVRLHGDDFFAMGTSLGTSLEHLETATDHIVKISKVDQNVVALAATPYLRLAALVAGGNEMGKTLSVIRRTTGIDANYSPAFLDAKIARARFYAESIMSQTTGLLPTILSFQRRVLTLPVEQF